MDLLAVATDNFTNRAPVNVHDVNIRVPTQPDAIRIVGPTPVPVDVVVAGDALQAATVKIMGPHLDRVAVVHLTEQQHAREITPICRARCPVLRDNTPD